MKNAWEALALLLKMGATALGARRHFVIAESPTRPDSDHRVGTMPRGKKKFIDKKKASTFVLLHRSQQDADYGA